MSNLNQIFHTNGKVDLRKIEEVPVPYRNIFINYPHFNVIQSTVYNDVFYSDESIVVSSPTGSGKTIIFELAIIKLLLDYETSHNKDCKIIYISPTKALCEERLIDWHKKFSEFSLSCISVTGDNPEVDISNLINSNLIITTPEKWDSLTRRWRDDERIVRAIKLFLIDEIHLLNDETRGSTLEAIVTRMKTIHSNIINWVNIENRIRFVGVSATIANPDDIANWFGINGQCAKYFKFDDSMRPVKLQKIVQGYPFNPAASSPFKFDIMLGYKLHNVLLQHSSGKPSLIFCSTRKSVEMTCKQLVQNLTIDLSSEQKGVIAKATSSLDDPKIKEVLVHGVGCHHAGMLPEDRRLVENLFREGKLPILVTTSTLAMGVNLPAHLVIIKSTKYYTNGGYRDYSESMLFQMIGRAGRPQFDNQATAVIMTTSADKKKFENMIGGTQPVESHLHKSLAEHVNAEVVLRTITDLGIAMQWLSSTFLYVRARKNPKHYGLPVGLSNAQLDKRLLDMCQIEINKLARVGMLTMDQNVSILPTRTGYLMARYCAALETMKLFTQVSGKEILQQILGLISKCHEFSDIRLRNNDKRPLNILNQNRNKKTIRFPLNGKIKTLDMKINCIIQAVLGSLEISETSLVVEAQRIMRFGERLLNCLSEYLADKEKCYKALLSSVTLAKCFHARIWENSAYVSRQLEGIGLTLSNLLASAGKTTFEEILKSNPRDLERILGKKPPAGNRIHDQVKTLPRYVLIAKEVILDDGKVTVEVTIVLENRAVFEKDITVNPNSVMNLIIGDSENNVLLHEKYTHMYMIDNIDVVRTVDVKTGFEHDIFINFISEDWVGIDIQTCIKLFKSEDGEDDGLAEISKKTDVLQQQPADSTNGKVRLSEKPKRKDQVRKSHMLQQLMDQYFKKTKTVGERALARKKSNGELRRKTGITKMSEFIINRENNEQSAVSNTLNSSLKAEADCSQGEDRANSNTEILNCKENDKAYNENNLVPDSNKNIYVEKEPNENISISDNCEQYNNILADIVKTSISVFDEIKKKQFKVIEKADQSQNTDVNSDIIPSTPLSCQSKLRQKQFTKSNAKYIVSQRKLERRLAKNIENHESTNQAPNNITLDLSQFAKRPKKRMMKDKPLEGETKKISLENNRQDRSDCKSLTWSSPLVISPKLKFSPQLSKKSTTFLETYENNSNSDNRKKLPSLRDKVKVSGISDKDCDPNWKNLNLTDILSESLLEGLGVKTKPQKNSGNDSLTINLPNLPDEIKNIECDLNQTVLSTSSTPTTMVRQPKMTTTIDSTTYYSHILKQAENLQSKPPEFKCVASQTENEIPAGDQSVESDDNGKINQREQNAKIKENFENINLAELKKSSFNQQKNLSERSKEVQNLDLSIRTNSTWEESLPSMNHEKLPKFFNHNQQLSEKPKESTNQPMQRQNSWEEAFLACEPILENKNEASNQGYSYTEIIKKRKEKENFYKNINEYDESNYKILKVPPENAGIAPVQNQFRNQETACANSFSGTIEKRINECNNYIPRIPHCKEYFEKDYYTRRLQEDPDSNGIPKISHDQKSSQKQFNDWLNTSNFSEFPENIADPSFANESYQQDQHQYLSNYKIFDKNPSRCAPNHPYNFDESYSHHQALKRNLSANFDNCQRNFTNVYSREKENYINTTTNFQREMSEPSLRLPENPFHNKRFEFQNKSFPLSEITNVRNMHRRSYSGDNMRNIQNTNFNLNSQKYVFGSNSSPRSSTSLCFENGNNLLLNASARAEYLYDAPTTVDNGMYFDIGDNVTYQTSYFDAVGARGCHNSAEEIYHPNQSQLCFENNYVHPSLPQSKSQTRNCFNPNCMVCTKDSDVNTNCAQEPFRKHSIVTHHGNKLDFRHIKYKNTQPFVNYDQGNNNNNVKNQISRYFDFYPKQQMYNPRLLNLNHTITSENQYNLNHK